MIDLQSFWARNHESFWINILAGIVFFVLSVWLVPKYTLRLIRKRNKKFLKQKISFAIQELCEFFNRMPPSFIPNESGCVVYAANIKYPKYDDFVALFKSDLFKPAAYEELLLNVLKTIQDMDSTSRHELIESEISRLNSLQGELESMVGIHANALQEEIVNEISHLCLDIRITIKKHKDDHLFAELLKQNEGTFGASHLKDVYASAFSLLKNLVKQDGFSIKKVPI